MGAEFQFGMTERFRRWIVVMHSSVNALNATELFTEKWLTGVCMLFHNNVKNTKTACHLPSLKCCWEFAVQHL